MKTVGIVGGFGPETTSKFYLEVILGCKKINKMSYPHILIDNVSYPFSVEEKAITEGGGEENFLLPHLINSAKSLEKSGADFLVLPCNSLHVFIEDIRNSVEIPVISILEETSKFLKAKGIQKVGIIATKITVENKLYENILARNKIKQTIPSSLEQVEIGKLIHNLVANKYSNRDREILMKIIQNFRESNVKNIILACTDLQLLMPKINGIKIYDTMKILADATVQELTS